MTLNKSCHLLTFIIPLILLYSACGPSGTVTVIDDSPEVTPAPAETDTSEREENFLQLTLGILDPVTNLDPPFADNLSTMRILSLIYDGLYTLTPDGDPVPSLAEDVGISEDGLEYAITIDRENHYHDSDTFSSGLGRRIHADDIKWAFERTAQADVPEAASRLLMNIEGYENYYLEQRTVYDEEKRVLEGVDGIQVTSPNTIVFVLLEEDPLFLHKLASPYLFIYPQESLQQNSNGLKHNPVGTGSYSFSSRDEDNRIILTHESPDGPEQAINRIDVLFYNNERDLFQNFAGKEIDWIPEIGPRTYQQILNSEAEVSSSYEGKFEATEHNAFRISSFYINRRSTAGYTWLSNRLNGVTEEDFSVFGEYQLQDINIDNGEDADPDSVYYIPFTDNKIAHNILNDLQEVATEPESSLAFFNIRVPTPSAVLYSLAGDSFHNEWNPLPSDYWLRINTTILSLHQPHLEGIRPSIVPWLVHIENIRLNRSENNLQ